MLDGYSTANLQQALHLLDDAGCRGVMISDNAPQTSFQQLLTNFRVIPAGGALVRNTNNDILMIYRRGKWDLPKGKQDDGETIEACTLREISEETGLTHLLLGNHLCDTYHIYEEKGQHCVKHTTWFYMSNTQNEQLLPQAEEDIDEARWVNPGDLAPFMGNTYSAIKDVLVAAGLHW
ncbi:MAG: NUDIX domain-containing protein [Chitinophagia bacterium]|nr:NUDIX domain-containing protein [Chitinophagia bacterium]